MSCVENMKLWSPAKATTSVKDTCSKPLASDQSIMSSTQDMNVFLLLHIFWYLNWNKQEMLTGAQKCNQRTTRYYLPTKLYWPLIGCLDVAMWVTGLIYAYIIIFKVRESAASVFSLILWYKNTNKSPKHIDHIVALEILLAYRHHVSIHVIVCIPAF